MTKRLTKSECDRIVAMLKLGCVCCAEVGYFVRAECHHILSGNRRMGHRFSIPLCCGHHRGIWSTIQLSVIPQRERVSIAGGRKLFTAIYGPELKLWQRIQRALGMDDALPTSKIVSRAA
jgi:Recombination enhancement, RecA-dependent nuclease